MENIKSQIDSLLDELDKYSTYQCRGYDNKKRKIRRAIINMINNIKNSKDKELEAVIIQLDSNIKSLYGLVTDGTIISEETILIIGKEIHYKTNEIIEKWKKAHTKNL